MKEFDLIDHYFNVPQAGNRKDVLLGIGDDCALLRVPPKHILAVSIDALVMGTHFTAATPPHTLGHKALAIGLSDLAAMGATPSWVTLALNLPQANARWLKEFSRGFFALMHKYSVQLIGGNISRGPLSITTQVHGFLPLNKSLQRGHAKSGDLIFVTGKLGDAALGFKVLLKTNRLKNRSDENYALRRLNLPQPRVEQGMALLNIANAAIDISDGLLADLGHILEMSQMDAIVYPELLPLSNVMRQNTSRKQAWQMALTGGDDYELCFTVSPKMLKTLKTHKNFFPCGLTQIGVITKRDNQTKHHKPHIHLHTKTGEKITGLQFAKAGYEHQW